MDFTVLDEEILKKLEPLKPVFVFRIGSSLNPDYFDENSDIDYIVICPVFYRQFVNEYEGRVSPRMSEDLFPAWMDNFHWRLEDTPFNSHKVIIVIYTSKKFYRYVEERSPPKMYLLNEHLLLKGDPAAIERLREENPPDDRTAWDDLGTLRNTKYAAGYLWQWRSVALLETKRWLRNKAEIDSWLAKNEEYLNEKDNKTFLIRRLAELLASHSPISDRVRM